MFLQKIIHRTSYPTCTGAVLLGPVHIQRPLFSLCLSCFLLAFSLSKELALSLQRSIIVDRYDVWYQGLLECSYVYARVRQDERMHRGAEQRSIILVSEHPYTSILLPVSSTVGPALLHSFHDTAATLLQASRQSWPAATPGSLTSVIIGPHRVVGRIPLDACLPHAETQLWQPIGAPNTPSAAWAPLCGAYGEVCLARTLQAHHRHLWSLWEVMLLGQPAMVFCSSPQRASTAVLALLALITPLPYEPDYRPLLSIHDPQVADVQVCTWSHAPAHVASRKPLIFSAAAANSSQSDI